MSLCVRHRETFLLRLLSHLSCFVAASWKLCCAIQALAEQDEFLARHRSVVLSPSSQTQSRISPHVYTSGTAGSHPPLQAVTPHSPTLPVPSPGQLLLPHPQGTNPCFCGRALLAFWLSHSHAPSTFRTQASLSWLRF